MRMTPPIHRTTGIGKRGPLPLKRMRISDWVRREIALGRFLPGDRIPDRRWFLHRFKAANLPLVQQAFADLEREGFVVSASRRGTCVAERLPFAGRYLLLVKDGDGDGGANFFTPSLRAAAKALAEERGIRFEVMNLTDARPGEAAYGKMIEEVRRQHYAGVVVQHLHKGHGLDTVTNLDDVPMVFFGLPSEYSQGNRVRSFDDGCQIHPRVFRLQCEDCASQGLRRIAAFIPHINPLYARPDEFSRLAAEAGLGIVANGLQTVDISHWNPDQFRRLAALFAASDAGREAKAVVLMDENMLAPFAEVCGSRYRIFCHCNAPILPKSRLPVRFHGVDCTATLASALDYMDAVRTGSRTPSSPRIFFV